MKVSTIRSGRRPSPGSGRTAERRLREGMRVHGLISRRVLLNYRCEPGIASALLPDGLRPRRVSGQAIVGVCLIEIAALRPPGLPRWTGLSSMNAGYRISVEWGDRPVRYGVYLPRRDTSSRLAAWLGGRAFPGVQHLSSFTTSWADDSVTVNIESQDRRADLRLTGAVGDRIPSRSVFSGLDEVSAFFRDADVGFSPGRRGIEGLRLSVADWRVRGFEVHDLRSGYFEDRDRFPAGSMAFDSAVFMRNVEHAWRAVEPPLP